MNVPTTEMPPKLREVAEALAAREGEQNPLRREHLDDFLGAYQPGARGEREESERVKRFTYAELLQRDKGESRTRQDFRNLP